MSACFAANPTEVMILDASTALLGVGMPIGIGVMNPMVTVGSVVRS